MQKTVALLYSGGIDSSVLLACMARQGHRVQPIYIRSDLLWSRSESIAAREFIDASPIRCEPLATLDLPLADLYRGHWSETGKGVPDAQTPDSAAFLPGRNCLLAFKAAVWCQIHGISQLALGVLDSNPFADARPAFFEALQATLNFGATDAIEFLRPFAGCSKQDLLGQAVDLPLELTFSCLSPAAGKHCGQCNKCGERRQAFEMAGIADRTEYANSVAV